MAERLRTARPRARKPHACDSCTGPIAKGETYTRDTLVYDDRVYDWLTCDPCEQLHVEVWDWAGRPDEGIDSSSYEDWAREHVDDPKHGEAARALLERMGGAR